MWFSCKHLSGFLLTFVAQELASLNYQLTKLFSGVTDDKEYPLEQSLEKHFFPGVREVLLAKIICLNLRGTFLWNALCCLSKLLYVFYNKILNTDIRNLNMYHIWCFLYPLNWFSPTLRSVLLHFLLKVRGKKCVVYAFKRTGVFADM